MRHKLIRENVARFVMDQPCEGDHEEIRAQCWEIEEARAFLEKAKAAGPQPAAFYRLALESGARKGELCAFKWADLDVEAGKIRVMRQMIKRWPVPILALQRTGNLAQSIFLRKR